MERGWLTWVWLEVCFAVWVLSGLKTKDKGLSCDTHRPTHPHTHTPIPPPLRGHSPVLVLYIDTHDIEKFIARLWVWLAENWRVAEGEQVEKTVRKLRGWCTRGCVNVNAEPPKGVATPLPTQSLTPLPLNTSATERVVNAEMQLKSYFFRYSFWAAPADLDICVINETTISRWDKFSYLVQAVLLHSKKRLPIKVRLKNFGSEVNMVTILIYRHFL